MKYILKIAFVLFISAQSIAQGTAAYSFCGKSGDCTMTWYEFLACKMKLVQTE